MEYAIFSIIIIVYAVMYGIQWHALIKANSKDRKNQDILVDLSTLQDGYILYRDAIRNMDIEKYIEFENKIKSIESNECQKDGKKEKIITILTEMKNSEEIYFQQPSKSRVKNNSRLFFIGLTSAIFVAVAGALVAIKDKTPYQIFTIFLALFNSHMFNEFSKEKNKDDEKENKMKRNYIEKVIEIMNSESK